MPLPKPKYPKYTSVLPSNGKTISYRPWTVAEEKILLTALEGDDKREILDAMTTVIEGCTSNEVTKDNVASFDFEYVFLQTRIKSVAPTVTVLYNNQICQETCGDDFRLNINLEDVRVVSIDTDGNEVEYKKLPDDHNRIWFDETTGVVMRYPTVEMLKGLTGLKGKELFDRVNIACIETIFDGDAVYTRNDYSDDEIVEWYESQLRKNKEKMADFINSVPRLRYTTQYKCPGCGRVENIAVEGLRSFFG